MPELRARVRRENLPVGGIVSYPLERMLEEVAFLAINLGWGRAEILQMTHHERLRWVTQVSRLNARRNHP